MYEKWLYRYEKFNDFCLHVAFHGLLFYCLLSVLTGCVSTSGAIIEAQNDNTIIQEHNRDAQDRNEQLETNTEQERAVRDRIEEVSTSITRVSSELDQLTRETGTTNRGIEERFELAIQDIGTAEALIDCWLSNSENIELCSNIYNSPSN